MSKHTHNSFDTKVFIRLLAAAVTAIAGVFASVTPALAAGAPPDGYGYCADEGQRCNFNGTKDVAYGANGKFAYRSGISGGVDCSNDVFGDPAYSVKKACYVKDTSGGSGGDSGAPRGYTYCAREGQRCNFDGIKDVAYGANGKFVYRFGVTGGVDCSNNVFGDPAHGVGKACHIKDARGGSSTFTVDTDLNTVVDVTGAQIDRAIRRTRSDSPLIGLGQTFVDVGNDLGINAYYIAAHAAWESSWGTSSLAQDKNNLFGYGAYDHCPYECALSYDSKADCVRSVMNMIKADYLTPDGKYYNGSTLRGMNQNYATDTNWMKGIAQIMNSLVARSR